MNGRRAKLIRKLIVPAVLQEMPRRTLDAHPNAPRVIYRATKQRYSGMGLPWRDRWPGMLRTARQLTGTEVGA